MSHILYSCADNLIMGNCFRASCQKPGQMWQRVRWLRTFWISQN